MHKPATLLTALSFSLVACGSDAPPPSEVRARLASDLGNVLEQTAAAADGSTQQLPGESSLSLLGKAFSLASFGFGDDGGGEPPPNFLARLVPEDPISEDFDPQQIIDQLNTTIFTDANHVGDGIYDIPADLACTTYEYDPDLGTEMEVLDPECVANWDDVDLRIRVAEDDDALVFALQVGANHDEPLEVSLTHTSLAVSLDLDAAEAATETLAAAFGEDAPNARLAGRVTGKLTVLGTAHVDVDLTIDRAIDVAFADNGESLDGASAVRFTSAAANVVSVELDGTAGVGELDLALGATTAHIPGDDSTDIALGGFSASLALAANAPLTVTNLSLGQTTTTVHRNGVQAFAIDLNPDDGRTLSASLQGDGSGNEVFSVEPKLDLRVSVNHAALGSSAPLYDVTRVLLDGSLTSSELTETVAVDGTFAITTNPAQYGFSATTGQCVAATEEYDDGSGEFYTAWSVTTCGS